MPKVRITAVSVRTVAVDPNWYDEPLEGQDLLDKVQSEAEDGMFDDEPDTVDIQVEFVK